MTDEVVAAERSISFSAPMLLALLAGRKTQTRRVVKPQPAPSDRPTDGPSAPATLITGQRCPYGMAGQGLWVREAFRLPSMLDALTPAAAGALALHAGRATPALHAGAATPVAAVEYPADGCRRHWPATDASLMPGRWRSPMFMPRWASRLALTLTDVRLERLQAISEVDALAEGVTPVEDVFAACDDAVALYRSVWERLHGAGSWQADPWVWVLRFRVEGAG